MAAILGVSAADAGETPSLDISVTGLDAPAKKCGITDADIRSHAAAVLVARGIQVSSTFPPTNPWLYISLNSLYLEPVDVCIASVTVQLLGGTERDAADDPIGAFHSRNRVTQLSSSETLTTRKRSAGFQQLLMQNLEKDIGVVLGRVTY